MREIKFRAWCKCKCSRKWEYAESETNKIFKNTEPDKNDSYRWEVWKEERDRFCYNKLEEWEDTHSPYEEIYYKNNMMYDDFIIYPCNKIQGTVNTEVIAVMQCTGYKAKGNVEVYGGDIVKGVIKGTHSCFGITGEVVFGFGSFYVEQKYPTGYKERVLLSKLKNIEVIGSIYENPELLEG